MEIETRSYVLVRRQKASAQLEVSNLFLLPCE